MQAVLVFKGIKEEGSNSDKEFRLSLNVIPRQNERVFINSLWEIPVDGFWKVSEIYYFADKNTDKNIGLYPLIILDKMI